MREKEERKGRESMSNAHGERTRHYLTYPLTWVGTLRYLFILPLTLQRQVGLGGGGAQQPFKPVFITEIAYDLGPSTPSTSDNPLWGVDACAGLGKMVDRSPFVFHVGRGLEERIALRERVLRGPP